MFVALIGLGSILAELIIAIEIVAVLFVIFSIGRLLLGIIFGILANSVLGLLSILVLNYIFSLSIPLTLPVIVATAIFGLPAVGTMVILKVLGASLI